MSYKNRVLFSAAGHVPAQDLIEKILDEHKSMLGVGAALTIVNDDKSEEQALEILVETGDMPPIEEIMQQFEAYKEDNFGVVFGDFPKEFDAESEQPYIILRADPADQDSAPILVAFIDAECPSHDEAGTNGADIIADVLRGALPRFLQTASDMDELVETMQTDPAIPKMLKGLYKDRATIFMMAEGGATWDWGDNKHKVEFEGGWVSQGEKKTIVEKAQDVVKAVRTFGSSRKGAGAAASAKDKTATSAGSLQPATTEQTVIHQKTVGVAADTGDAAYVLVTPNDTWSKDQKRTFYKQLNAGIVPNGFKDNPAIKVLRASWDKWVKANGIKFGIEKLAEVVPLEPTTSKVEVIPKAPPAELRQHKEVFMKRPQVVISNEGKTIIDPKRQEEMEATYATYAEIAGYDSLRPVLTYSNEDFADLIAKTPVLAMILMGNLVGEIIRRTPEEELNPSVEEEVVPLKATGTDVKVAGKPAPKAAGPRTFGKKK